MFKKTNWNLTITWITASIIFLFIFITALIYKNGEEKSLFFLTAVFGASIGWGLGILATPFDVNEQRRLSEIAKIAYGFLTGYLISKIDTIFNNLISENLLAQEELWILVIVTITSLTTSLTTTYINRSYWLDKIYQQRMMQESPTIEEEPEKITEDY